MVADTPSAAANAVVLRMFNEQVPFGQLKSALRRSVNFLRSHPKNDNGRKTKRFHEENSYG
jgi:hypothetical protein